MRARRARPRAITSAEMDEEGGGGGGGAPSFPTFAIFLSLFSSSFSSFDSSDNNTSVDAGKVKRGPPPPPSCPPSLPPSLAGNERERNQICCRAITRSFKYPPFTKRSCHSSTLSTSPEREGGRVRSASRT